MGWVSMVLIGCGCFAVGVLVGGALMAALAVSSTDDWEADG